MSQTSEIKNETMIGYASTESKTQCNDNNSTTLMGSTIDTDPITFASNDIQNNNNILQYATVIGAGHLGSRIAVELARCNVNVFLYDAIESSDSVKHKVQQILSQSLYKCKSVLLDGKQNQNTDETLLKQIASTFDNTMKRMHFVDELISAVNHPELQIIFEAIIENFNIKINLFRQIEKHIINKNCILSSNTLSFPIIEISNRLQNMLKYKFIGIRWLWPVVFIPFIEITYSKHKEHGYNATVIKVNSLLESINKDVFLCPIKSNEWKTKTYSQINEQRLRLSEKEADRHQKMQIRKYFLYRKDKDMNKNINEDAMECIICLDNEANIVSITCGHKVICQSCAKLLTVEMNARCPVCRELCGDMVESSKITDVDIDDALLSMDNIAMNDVKEYSQSTLQD